MPFAVENILSTEAYIRLLESALEQAVAAVTSMQKGPQLSAGNVTIRVTSGPDYHKEVTTLWDKMDQLNRVGDHSIPIGEFPYLFKTLLADFKANSPDGEVEAYAPSEEMHCPKWLDYPLAKKVEEYLTNKDNPYWSGDKKEGAALLAGILETYSEIGLNDSSDCC